VYLRVNSVATPWFHDDINVAAKLHITGVLLPKADTAEDVARGSIASRSRSGSSPSSKQRSAPERPRGRACPRVERLVFGALDFQLDTGMHDEGDTFASVRSRIAMASGSPGSPPQSTP
jgi:citrate lyase subunit beta/citryl-CoA lyase